MTEYALTQAANRWAETRGCWFVWFAVPGALALAVLIDALRPLISQWRV